MTTEATIIAGCPLLPWITSSQVWDLSVLLGQLHLQPDIVM